MYHQIQNHRNIRSSRIKLSQTVDFNEFWFADKRLRSDKRRIVALYMPYLRPDSLFVTKLNNLFCLLQGLSYRLFYEKIQASFYGYFSIVMMIKCRRHNVQNLYFIQEFVQVFIKFVSKFCFQLFGIFYIFIMEAHQIVFF